LSSNSIRRQSRRRPVEQDVWPHPRRAIGGEPNLAGATVAIDLWLTCAPVESAAVYAELATPPIQHCSVADASSEKRRRQGKVNQLRERKAVCLSFMAPVQNIGSPVVALIFVNAGPIGDALPAPIVQAPLEAEGIAEKHYQLMVRKAYEAVNTE